MTQALWLDTDVILRYLLADHPDQSERALAVFESAERGEVELRILTYVICETVYVLEGQAYTRREIHDALSRLMAIPGVRVDDGSAVQVALTWYRDKGVDFGDALLYAQCCDGGGTALTFNEKHFRRLGTEWTQP